MAQRYDRNPESIKATLFVKSLKAQIDSLEFIKTNESNPVIQQHIQQHIQQNCTSRTI